jgi:DNA-binding NarL/FixJ family response regulator
MTYPSLTEREREVAELVAQGFGYAEIGARLKPPTAARTVEAHVRAIAQKIPDNGLPSLRRIMLWMLETRRGAA